MVINRYNKWKKRGIALVPTVQGVGIEAIHCNQAGALVHVYTDGSVLLTHGGVEMGQVSLNTSTTFCICTFTTTTLYRACILRWFKCVRNIYPFQWSESILILQVLIKYRMLQTPQRLRPLMFMGWLWRWYCYKELSLYVMYTCTIECLRSNQWTTETFQRCWSSCRMGRLG